MLDITQRKDLYLISIFDKILNIIKNDIKIDELLKKFLIFVFLFWFLIYKKKKIFLEDIFEVFLKKL